METRIETINECINLLQFVLMKLKTLLKPNIMKILMSPAKKKFTMTHTAKDYRTRSRRLKN